MKERNDFISLLKEHPWSDNDNPIWIASTLKLYRNVNKYLFPSKLESSKQKQLLQLISKSILPLDVLSKPLFLEAQEIGSIGKQYLFEHFLAAESFHEAHGSEGFVIDATGSFFGLINVKDHLQIQMLDCKGDLENTWNRLVGIETNLGKTIDFAFSSRFGFLTSNPHHCGTGFVTHAYLHLPAIIHSNHLFAMLEKEADENIVASGIQGDLTELVGDILTIHNRATIGVTEEDIIKSLRSLATKLMVAEKGVRSHLQGQEESAIKNKVSRAYGLAFHSYEFEAVEALNTISLCKLGVDLGWIEGIDHKTLNNLFFNSRRGHLMSNYPEIKQEELPHKRAELIHTAFKPTKLLI